MPIEIRRTLLDFRRRWQRGSLRIPWDTCRYPREPGRRSLSLHSLCRTTLPAGHGSSRALPFKGELRWAYLGTAGKKGAAASPAFSPCFPEPAAAPLRGSVPRGTWGGTASVSPRASHFAGGMRKKLFQINLGELLSLSEAPFLFCGIFLFSSHPLALNSRITQN